MIKSQLKKWVIGISLSVAAAGGITYACGDYWDESEAYDYNVMPSILMDSTFRPFFFDFGDFYYSRYGDNGLNIHINRFNDIIAKEWYDYVGGKISLKQIDYIINGKDSIAHSAPLMGAYKSGKAKFQNIDLTDAKVKHFFQFFDRAQALDNYATTEIYSWYQEDEKPKAKADKSLIAEFESYYNAVNAKDDFLKNRYWFQVAKALFYSRDKQSVISFFEKTQHDMPKNILYYRAMSYVAGAYLEMKHYDQANYLYSIVFDRCEEMREVAMYNFKIQDEKKINDVLRLAKNTDEKVALWAMIGYRGMTTKAMEEIYALKPNSKYLELLAANSMMNVQTQLANTNFKSIAAYQENRAKHMDNNLYKLTAKIATSEKTSNPGLWYTYAALCGIYANDLDQANQYLSKAKVHFNDQNALEQIQVLEYVSFIHSIKKVAGHETKLIEILTWLDKKYEAYENSYGYDETKEAYIEPEGDGNIFSHPKRFAKQFIAKLYQDAGLPILEELFEPTKGYYKNNTALENMKTFLKSGGNNALERYAVKKYIYTVDDIYYYQGVLAYYRKDLKAAFGYFKETKLAKETTFQVNPFNGNIKDCFDCDVAKPQKTNYSVIDLVSKMIEMQAKIDRNDDVYNNALLLGNAFYSTSYYGTGRIFYQTSNILDEYGIYISDEHNALLKNSILPNEYYRLASKHATLDEQRAKTAYLLAKTERNMYYFNEYDTDGGGYNTKNLPDFKAWNGFKELKKYSNTKYYKEVLSDCGYFNNYVNR